MTGVPCAPWCVTRNHDGRRRGQYKNLCQLRGISTEYFFLSRSVTVSPPVCVIKKFRWACESFGSNQDPACAEQMSRS